MAKKKLKVVTKLSLKERFGGRVLTLSAALEANDEDAFMAELNGMVRDRDDALKAFQFCSERLCTNASDLIVDAPFIIHFGVDALVAFFDQPCLEHPLERPVERSGSHADLALRVDFDLFHDAVAVTFSVGKRHEDVEYSGCKRWGCACHTHTISATDIVVKMIIKTNCPAVIAGQFISGDGGN